VRSLQLLTLAFLATAAKADPFLGPYYDIPCGGLGQVKCSIVQGGQTPTAQDLQGLDNAAFVQFFQGIEQGPNPGFSWGPVGASADGYVIGSVDGDDNIDTGFVYHNGQVLCCMVDEPFQLAGINNLDVIIGWNQDSGPFVADAASAGTTDVNEEQLTFANPSFDPYALGPFDFFFTAIDDQNRILADINGQQYMFTPTPVPEPASVLLLGIGLILCVMLLRSRMRRPSA
jgi:hypothetical protein